MTIDSDSGATPIPPPPPKTPLPEIPPAIFAATPPFNDPPLNFTADVLSLLRALLARNPFYIISAMLLLWSMRELSLDSRIFPEEFPQLIFNFSAFQAYEWLLAGTAIFLARRRVWYDSGLLVALENLFICVPFLLVSQALLLENSVAAAFCISGGALAAVRVSGLRRRLKEMNLSSAWLWAGGALLALNFAWPVLVRNLHKDVDIPIWDNRGLLLTAVEWNWLIPVAVAFAALLPMREFACGLREGEERPFYAWRIFPVVALLMWIAGTSVHLYSIGYVYGLPWRWAYLAPTVWVLTWVAWRRWSELFPGKWRGAERFLFLQPVLAVLFDAHAGRPAMCLTLALLSAAVYGLMAFARRDGLAKYAAAFSALAAIYFTPLHAGIGRGLSLAEFLGGGTLIFLVGWALISRRAVVGLMGGICLGLGMAVLLPSTATMTNIAAQAGLIFIMLHSLRWDSESAEASKARIFCGACWILHTAVWNVCGTVESGLCTTVFGVSVSMVFICARFIIGRWQSLTIAVCAAVVGWVGCVYFLLECFAYAPRGLQSLVGSFALFGLGTLAALMKSKWMRKRAVESSQAQ